jgi:hypothetical protein
MERIWGCKIPSLFLVGIFVCICIGCNGDDSCIYEIEGFVKNANDSTPLTDVKITLLYYDFGGKGNGEGGDVLETNNSGRFSFEYILTPQYAYECPLANDIEFKFRYVKDGFEATDTIFKKGTISDGGTDSKNRNKLELPTIFLKKL